MPLRCVSFEEFLAWPRPPLPRSRKELITELRRAEYREYVLEGRIAELEGRIGQEVITNHEVRGEVRGRDHLG